MELGPGLIVGNKVRLERVLGEGGMGSVWLATHLSLQTGVAVKFISLELASDETVQRRFTSEALSSAQIKSPHVVQILDHGVAEGRPYIVMELLEGEDLAGRIERLRRVPLPETAEIIRQAAKGLSAAHAIGIIHRDIKPANIFLTQSAGETFVKLLDFGIAKNASGDNYAKTATGTMLGTPYYMSPEQVIAEGTADHRADVWALAVVAYECLTGELPFGGTQLGAIYVAIHSGVFRKPSAINPSLPPGIDGFFGKAFAKSPDERFASAKELADSLAFIGLGGSRVSHISISPDGASTSDGASAKDVMHAQTLAGTAFERGAGRKGRRAAILIGALALGLVGFGALVVVGLSKGSGDGSSQGAPVASVASEPASSAASALPSAAPDVSPVGSAAASTAPPESSVEVAPSAAASAKPVESKPSGAHSAAPHAAGASSPSKPSVSVPPSTKSTTTKRRNHGF